MPDWKSIVRERLASLGMAAGAESDLTEEIAQHLEDRYRELRGGGAGEAEALRIALAEMEETYPTAGYARTPRFERVPAGDPQSSHFLTDGWRDLRYAFRTFRKSPIFVLFVVITLALGIGANTTVFTVINTLILNPLPVRKTAELAAVSAGPSIPVSYADFQDYRKRNEVFTSFAAYTSVRGITWQHGGASEGLFTELATENYFATLGLTPAKGRFFAAEENSRAGAHPVAVMSYGAWQTRFGGAEDILGTKLRLNGIVFTVIGVAPPGFIGVNSIFGPDVWMPAAMADRVFPNQFAGALTDRAKPAFLGVGRLKPGVTNAQAQGDLATIASSLAAEFPADQGHAILVRPIRDALYGSTGAPASSFVFGSAALLVVVGIVLLIACSNVANLLLARSAARSQEMAVRLAMGASRRRLVRQLLTESVLLGILSGALGLGIAFAGLRMLFGALPGAANFVSPKLDGTVFGFALAVSVATGFLFGTIPAFRSSRADIAESLKESARTAGRSRRKVTLSNALLVGQVAFSFLLLVTAAMFLRSIGRAYEMDPGFQTAHLAVFPTNPGQAGFGKPQTKEFYREVRERAQSVPGVASAAWSSNLPLWARPENGLEVEGRQQRSRTDTVRTIVSTVGLGFFPTAGVKLESGRDFTDQDGESSTPVAIVNEKAAHDYWPGGALGKRIRLPGEKQMRVIVGVARTANYSAWGEAPQNCVYVPMEQNYADGMTLYVRSKGDPREVLAAVEREIHATGPTVLVFGIRTGRELVDGGLFSARIGVVLLATFGLLALGLASIGLYGILAYSVNQRKREIGLRMALGATRADVLRLVMGTGMSLVLVGVAIGLGAALMMGRLASRLLYGVGASDPVSIGAAAVVLAAVALGACYLPARGATRVDPLRALHEG